MDSCRCFVALLSSSVWIATACDCWLLEQNKNEWMNEVGDIQLKRGQERKCKEVIVANPCQS